MPDSVAELVERGRALSTQDRERLVDELLATLNEPGATQLHADWEAEIGQRLAAYDAGEVQAVEAEEVFAKARRIAR